MWLGWHFARRDHAGSLLYPAGVVLLQQVASVLAVSQVTLTALMDSHNSFGMAALDGGQNPHSSGYRPTPPSPLKPGPLKPRPLIPRPLTPRPLTPGPGQRSLRASPPVGINKFRADVALLVLSHPVAVKAKWHSARQVDSPNLGHLLGVKND